MFDLCFDPFLCVSYGIISRLIFLTLIMMFGQVRKRPLNKKEVSRKEDDIVTVSDNASLSVHEPKLKVWNLLILIYEPAYV